MKAGWEFVWTSGDRRGSGAMEIAPEALRRTSRLTHLSPLPSRLPLCRLFHPRAGLQGGAGAGRQPGRHPARFWHPHGGAAAEAAGGVAR
eukprot:362094-Chlamydomonas_euryale.AAC.9